MSGRANVADDRALPESARTSWLTANSFALLRQPPIIGRDFVAGDDQKGAEPVVMLGYRFWMNRYGGDRNVIGKPVRVDGVAATIVGVMPESMQFPDITDVWMPLIPNARQEQRDHRPLRIFGRLADGVSVEQARVELNGIAQRIAKAYPDVVERSGRRACRNLLRTLRQRRSAHRVHRAALVRRLRAADRVRERREPAAVAIGAARA